VQKVDSVRSLGSLDSLRNKRFVASTTYRWISLLAKGSYIYIIYTPNLGLAITVFDREREHGRFRGSSEGVRGSSGGVRGE